MGLNLSKHADLYGHVIGGGRFSGEADLGASTGHCKRSQDVGAEGVITRFLFIRTIL